MLDLLSSCILCQHKCSVNRYDRVGFCGATDKLRVARASLHNWEEPCISGINGSGTIFFSYCNLKCVFCQNYSISHNSIGKEISIERLSDVFLELQSKKAHNINLVTPTHYIPQIIEALKIAKLNGLDIPIVYNTGTYENPDIIELLRGYIDIYLPDMKYFDNNFAFKYSLINDYFDCAKQNIEKMFNQVGEPVFDKNGIMQKGVIIRHLVLPTCKKDSKEIIKYLYDKYKNKVYISIMNQYTPPSRSLNKYPELNKPLSTKDYNEVVDYAVSIGVENGFIQEGETAKESFIPEFDDTFLGV